MVAKRGHGEDKITRSRGTYSLMSTPTPILSIFGVGLNHRTIKGNAAYAVIMDAMFMLCI